MDQPGSRPSPRHYRCSPPAIVAALCGLLLAVPATSADEVEWHRLDSQGWQKLQERKHTQAREAFQSAIAQAPKDFRLGQSHVGLAWAHHRLGDNAAALKSATMADPLTATHNTPERSRIRAELLHVLGRLHVAERRFKSSRQHFQQAAAINQKLVGDGERKAAFLFSFAELNRLEAHSAEAEKQLLQALDLARDKDHLQAIRRQLADVLLTLGKLRSAEEQLRKEAAVAPDLFHVLVDARLAFLEARYHDALSTLERDKHSQHSCPLASCTCANRLTTLWARSLVAVADFPAAKERIKQLTTVHEWEQPLLDSDRQVVAAEAALAVGGFKQAAADYRQALASREKALSAHDPDLCHILLGLSETIEAPLETIDKEHDDTVRLCDRVMKMLPAEHPDVAHAHWLLAQRSIYLARYAEAEESAAKAVKMYGLVLRRPEERQPLLPHPDHASALEVLAASWWAQKKPLGNQLDEARAIRVRHFNQLAGAPQKFKPLRYSQGNTELIHGWAYLCNGDRLLAQGRFLKAIEHFTHEQDWHPFDAEARLGLFLSRGATDQKTIATAEHYLVQRMGQLSTAYHYWRLGKLCALYDSNEEAWQLYTRSAAMYRRLERPADAKTLDKCLENLVKRRESPPRT